MALLWVALALVSRKGVDVPRLPVSVSWERLGACSLECRRTLSLSRPALVRPRRERELRRRRNDERRKRERVGWAEARLGPLVRVVWLLL